jgi:hypothetical protein
MKKHMAITCVKLWEDSTYSFCRKTRSYAHTFLYLRIKPNDGRSIPQQASDCAYLVPHWPSRSLIAKPNCCNTSNHKQQIRVNGVKLLSLYFVKYY